MKRINLYGIAELADVDRDSAIKQARRVLMAGGTAGLEGRFAKILPTWLFVDQMWDLSPERATVVVNLMADAGEWKRLNGADGEAVGYGLYYTLSYYLSYYHGQARVSGPKDGSDTFRRIYDFISCVLITTIGQFMRQENERLFEVMMDDAAVIIEADELGLLFTRDGRLIKELSDGKA
jgi:hypothetical protein